MNKSKRNHIELDKPLLRLARRDYFAAAAISLLTFGVYSLTAAPGVTMEDSGDFIMGVLTLGIVHPPGYPLYTVLGHLFSFIPIGEPAFRVNLFSALWGALCLGVMFFNLRILTIRPLHAAFTSLIMGFTTIFWSKTAVAEVYSFNAFLLASVVYWILCYNRDKKPWQLYLTALTTGLALSNHYPLAILTGLGLLFLLDRKDLKPTNLFKGALFLVLGLTPYLYLFVQASNPDLQYNFGKLSDAGMVVDHILRKNTLDGNGSTLWQKWTLSLWYLRALINNFLLSSLFLFSGILFGFKYQWKYRYPYLLASLCPSIGLILILGIPSDEIYRAYLTDFAIPSLLMFSVFLALGLKVLMDQYVKSHWLMASMLATLLLIQVAINFPRSSHHNDRLAEAWGTELLMSLKPNSALILCAASMFHIYSLQLIKGLRPDVDIYDRYSLWTKANLYAPGLLFKTTSADEIRRKRELDVLRNGRRPVYYTCRDAISDYDMEFTYTPFLIRADRQHLKDADPSQFTVSRPLLETLTHGYPKSEFWLDRMREVAFTRLITYFGGKKRPEVKQVIAYFNQSKLSSDPKFLLSVAKNLLRFKNMELALSFLNRAEEHSLKAFSQNDLTIYCSALFNERKTDKALEICTLQEKASAACTDHSIWAQVNLAKLHREKRNWAKVAEYSRQILRCQPDNPRAQRTLKLAAEMIRTSRSIKVIPQAVAK